MDKVIITDVNQKEKIIKKLSAVGICGNIILTAFKLIAGILGHSSAMISDAIHSMSDIFATVIAYIGLKAAEKDADCSHPYGHDRFESIATLILACILIATGIILGYSGIISLINGTGKSYDMGILPMIAAIVSILVKEAMYHYTRINANRIGSSVFRADAVHHRTDALSSVGALAGIIAFRNGIVWADAAASIVISLFIIYLGCKIFIQECGKLTDSACPEEFTTELSEFIQKLSVPGKIDIVKTRKFGEKIYIDIEISLPGNMSLQDSHAIAENIHNKTEEKYQNVKHIMVHVNPM